MHFLVYFLLLFLPITANGIIITEIQIEGESTYECYIKIYNPSNNDIDISGYKLRKKTSTGKDYSLRVFPSESIINKNDYFIWANSQNNDFPEKVNADVSSTQSLSYNNSVALFDKEDVVIDLVGWGEGDNQYFTGDILDNPNKNQIIKRVENNGIFSQTKNNKNDFYFYPPPPSPIDIKKISKTNINDKKINPFIISFVLSIFLASITIYFNNLQKNGRT